MCLCFGLVCVCACAACEPCGVRHPPKSCWLFMGSQKSQKQVRLADLGPFPRSVWVWATNPKNTYGTLEGTFWKIGKPTRGRFSGRPAAGWPRVPPKAAQAWASPASCGPSWASSSPRRRPPPRSRCPTSTP